MRELGGRKKKKTNYAADYLLVFIVLLFVFPYYII